MARIIEISNNQSIYNRKMIIDMKIQKSITFNLDVLFVYIKLKFYLSSYIDDALTGILARCLYVRP